MEFFNILIFLFRQISWKATYFAHWSILVLVWWVEGDLDYSFASAWHPDGKLFATGNQDKICQVWDLTRFQIFKGNMGAVLSPRFSSDGRFWWLLSLLISCTFMPPTKTMKKGKKLIRLEKSWGVSLSPDDGSLDIGVWDRTYASLLQYKKRHKYVYLDSFV